MAIDFSKRTYASPVATPVTINYLHFHVTREPEDITAPIFFTSTRNWQKMSEEKQTVSDKTSRAWLDPRGSRPARWRYNSYVAQKLARTTVDTGRKQRRCWAHAAVLKQFVPKAVTSMKHAGAVAQRSDLNPSGEGGEGEFPTELLRSHLLVLVPFGMF